MTDTADRVELVVPLAATLPRLVRNGRPDQLGEALAEADLPAVAVALAAMVPDHLGVRTLLGWHFPTGDTPDRVERAVPHAARLAAAVRDVDREQVDEALTFPDLLALVVALAGMVPADLPADVLLDWWGPVHRRRHDAARRRERRARNGRGPGKAQQGVCGTRGGVQRHSHRGEALCEACAAILAPCGTRTAHVRHLSRGEDPCEPCRAAAKEWERLRGQRRRAADRAAQLDDDRDVPA